MADKTNLDVLMVSTSYPRDIRDWKGVFIRHLALALSRAPNLKLSLWAPPGEMPDAVTYACTESESAWLNRLAASGGIAHRIRTGRFAGILDAVRLLWTLARAYRRHSEVDLVHVNWLQTAIPLLFSPKPALITVLGTDLALLEAPGVTAVMRVLFRRCRCVIAPNAQWMVPVLESRFGDLAEVRYIPFGIDDAWFSLARSATTKPEKWLVVARLTSAKIGPLFDWGKEPFEGQDRELHLFGPMQEQITVPSWVCYHGPTHPDDLLQNWFPGATGLLTLSRHDEGLPQVILEAMAASLPVLASDLPAHRSVITHRETGWISSDREDFARALEWLGNDINNRTVGEHARAYIRRTMGNWDDCANRYETAYGSLLER